MPYTYRRSLLGTAEEGTGKRTAEIIARATPHFPTGRAALSLQTTQLAAQHTAQHIAQHATRKTDRQTTANQEKRQKTQKQEKSKTKTAVLRLFFITFAPDNQFLTTNMDDYHAENLNSQA
jgi:hypothetical protein